jgi:dolichol-phosphate mannosyltransferase
MRLGLVVPLANEEVTVDEFLRRVLVQLSPGDAVFCVIDNASRDRTLELVEHHARDDERVMVVWAPENRCVVDAYFRGYRAAFEYGCDWILEIDGGLSHLPEQIPQFVAAMKRGHDFVVGSRFMTGGAFDGPLSRRLISYLGGRLANFLLGTRMNDMTSGYQCFTRPAMEMVLGAGVQSRGPFFQTEIKYMLRDTDYFEVPIRYSNPTGRVAAQSIAEALRILLRLSFRPRTRPDMSQSP